MIFHRNSRGTDTTCGCPMFYAGSRGRRLKKLPGQPQGTAQPDSASLRCGDTILFCYFEPSQQHLEPGSTIYSRNKSLRTCAFFQQFPFIAHLERPRSSWYQVLSPALLSVMVLWNHFHPHKYMGGDWYSGPHEEAVSSVMDLWDLCQFSHKAYYSKGSLRIRSPNAKWEHACHSMLSDC